MICRPVDASGDILPVFASSGPLTGIRAETELVTNRLRLLTGEWWENPGWGCEIFEMLRSGRFTAQDAPSLVSYLSSYILATPGVRAVEDVSTAVNGRQFSFFCKVICDDGSGEVSYSMNF